MDGFGLFLDVLCLAGQGVMHLFFAGRLAGRKPELWHFAVYGLLLALIQGLSAKWFPGGSLPVGMGVLALYAVSRFALGAPRPLSWLAAVLAFYVSQLSFGIINSLEAAVFPYYIGNPLLYLLLLLAQVLFFALCTCCYRAVLRLLPQAGERPYMELVLFPSLFFFAAELYILHTAHTFFDPSVSLEEAGKHTVLLLLQVMGLAALLCTLYAYRHLCQGFQAQAALQSLAQAAHTQEVYIAEAQLRYEQTKSFRHDIKNHLSVLDGLLRGGKLDEARSKDLERQLAQVERELREKDNDAYRRQHSTFTQLR